MNDRYKNAVEIAEKAVEGIKDPSLKLEGFKTILWDMLNERNSKESISVREPQNEQENIEEPSVPRLGNLFLKKLKISRRELELVYRIDGDKFELCSYFGSNGKWQQIQYVFLRLFGNYLATNNERRVSSQVILSAMKLRGFSKLPNLNAFLRELDPRLIYVKTFKKKSENFFELTLNGVNVCERLIRSIIENSGKTLSSPEEVFGINRKERSKEVGGSNSLRSPLALQIMKLINEGLLNKPITTQEIKKLLDEKGAIYEKGIVDEKIRRVFLGKELRRIEQEKKWHYFKNGN
ncbi:MAG: hypothetical protein KJ600_03315 [Nanoarchaeota archaeon]|nr:hypothetical protein [Nanoarchaeota archaeon]MBU1103557.1 hypothetical protein [Nanoarchaeota archaeon]